MQAGAGGSGRQLSRQGLSFSLGSGRLRSASSQAHTASCWNRGIPRDATHCTTGINTLPATAAACSVFQHAADAANMVAQGPSGTASAPEAPPQQDNRVNSSFEKPSASPTSSIADRLWPVGSAAEEQQPQRHSQHLVQQAQWGRDRSDRSIDIEGDITGKLQSAKSNHAAHSRELPPVGPRGPDSTRRRSPPPSQRRGSPRRQGRGSRDASPLDSGPRRRNNSRSPDGRDAAAPRSRKRNNSADAREGGSKARRSISPDDRGVRRGSAARQHSLAGAQQQHQQCRSGMHDSNDPASERPLREGGKSKGRPRGLAHAVCESASERAMLKRSPERTDSVLRPPAAAAGKQQQRRGAAVPERYRRDQRSQSPPAAMHRSASDTGPQGGKGAWGGAAVVPEKHGRHQRSEIPPDNMHRSASDSGAQGGRKRGRGWEQRGGAQRALFSCLCCSVLLSVDPANTV